MTANEFATTVASLPVELQNEFLASIKEVLTEEEYRATAMFISLNAIYHSPAKYHAMKEAVRDVVVEQFFGHEPEEPMKKWYYEDPCNAPWMFTIV